MTRDDIIRMARSDDWAADVSLKWDDFFVRFAALVAAAAIKDAPDYKMGYADGAAAEREACAQVAESYEPRCDSCPSGVANAIRARGRE